jgi:hypothetical protein
MDPRRASTLTTSTSTWRRSESARRNPTSSRSDAFVGELHEKVDVGTGGVLAPSDRAEDPWLKSMGHQGADLVPMLFEALRRRPGQSPPNAVEDIRRRRTPPVLVRRKIRLRHSRGTRQLRLAQAGRDTLRTNVHVVRIAKCYRGRYGCGGKVQTTFGSWVGPSATRPLAITMIDKVTS